MELIQAVKEIKDLDVDDMHMIADINKILLNLVWMNSILHKGEEI